MHWSNSPAIPADNVTLTSTLNRKKIAYPGQNIIFTCVTLHSGILQWSNNEYIGTGESRLELFSSGSTDRENSRINQHTYARRLNTTSDNEPRVIVSELHVTASLQHQIATITCANNGHGQYESITFQMRSKLCM